MYIQLQYNKFTLYNYATLYFGHSATVRTHTHVIACTLALTQYNKFLYMRFHFISILFVAYILLK